MKHGKSTDANSGNLVLHVAAKAVIIDPKGRVLIMREASAKTHPTNTKSGRYQLPGGRLKPGEKFVDGLRREIFEETGLEIEIGDPLLVGEWRPVVQGVPWQIVGVFIAAKAKSDKVRSSDEHDAFKWIDPVKYSNYDIIPPDWEAIDKYVNRVSSER